MLESQKVDNNKNIKLKIDKLKVYFPIERTLKDFIFNKPKKVVKAVIDVSLNVYENEVLGLVGETGCGKSTIARTILLMNPITSGKIIFQGKEIKNLNGVKLKEFFSKVQMIWQDSFSCLNPRMKVYDIISRPLIRFKNPNKREISKKVKETMKIVGLNENEMYKYPHEFSGGGRQRIAIARALIIKPSLLIADEPTSSLDVSIQAQILNLLKKLKDSFELTMVFISHNLAVINFVSDRIAIMYFGRIVELMPKRELLTKNYHWYTKKLVEAIPKGKRYIDTNITLEKNYRLNYEGCIYYYRCENAKKKCLKEIPKLVEFEKDHYVACHYPMREGNKSVFISKKEIIISGRTQLSSTPG